MLVLKGEESNFLSYAGVEENLIWLAHILDRPIHEYFEGYAFLIAENNNLLQPWSPTMKLWLVNFISLLYFSTW